MTTRIKLKNEDAHRTLVVSGTFDGKKQDEAVLQPGAEAEFWVHSTRDLRVSEGEPAIPAPAPTAPA